MCTIKPQVVRHGLNHVIGFTFISPCPERGHLILTQHLNQWPILLRVQLGRFEAFLETRQWSFFHSPPFLFILFYPWLRLRALWRTFFFSHCACPLKWIHCVWKHPAPQLRRRGERGATLKSWTLATALCSCTRSWNVVCQLHQGFAKKLLYGPIVRAQRGRYKKKKGGGGEKKPWA